MLVIVDRAAGGPPVTELVIPDVSRREDPREHGYRPERDNRERCAVTARDDGSRCRGDQQEDPGDTSPCRKQWSGRDRQHQRRQEW